MNPYTEIMGISSHSKLSPSEVGWLDADEYAYWLVHSKNVNDAEKEQAEKVKNANKSGR